MLHGEPRSGFWWILEFRGRTLHKTLNSIFSESSERHEAEGEGGEGAERKERIG
jgi:hypothetical protein